MRNRKLVNLLTNTIVFLNSGTLTPTAATPEIPCLRDDGRWTPAADAWIFPAEHSPSRSRLVTA